MKPVEVSRGDGPIVLGIPHSGTWLPGHIKAQLNDRGRTLADTDWHIDRLYHGLLPGATTVRATFHRYVIDANRSPKNESLYPGQNTTSLVPVTDFDGRPIWSTAPDAAEVAARRAAFHTPYHTALEVELKRVQKRHGVAILYDCHSIRSQIPYLFDGKLPDFNIGTASSSSCDERLEDLVQSICKATGGTTATNGRFKGGWATRHYGRPLHGIHAIQMELAQSTYLENEAPPFTYDELKSAHLRSLLAEILGRIASLAPELGR
ncbi:N-formylglutamate deformylase [Limibacillus halophilus]|uniref:Formiminoglutamase n=1 Tax=Limibacillus halophilus TaxID=1579333 RepID=A0A839SLR9_9PROT|nr:N-formylglutamate deformylase [Limibacillus halophilus]MBB3063771.1 formiminoglutamase [Limibacillus halophilus]